MTNPKKTEDSMDDLDLDITDISGEVNQTPVLQVVASLESAEVAAAISAIEQRLTPEQREEMEWQAILNRLSTFCEKEQSWIILRQEDNSYVLRDGLTCTSQEYYDWIIQTYPPASDLTRYKHSPEDYDDITLRKKAVRRVSNLVKDLKFPKGSMSIKN